MKRQKSRVLSTVHNTAKALHKVGLIDKRAMKKYEILCVESVPDYPPQKIKALRKRYNISQAVLAGLINTSLSAVCKWEIGEKHPSGPSLKLLNILDQKGIEVLTNVSQHLQ